MPGASPGDLFDTPAARALRVLLPPLRFAARDSFAAIDRLRELGPRIAGAVAAAREAGAPESAALAALAREGEAFDALAGAERRAALARIAAALGGLLPLPEELADLARRARIERGALDSAAPAEPLRSGRTGEVAEGRTREVPGRTEATSVRAERRPPQGAEVDARPAIAYVEPADAAERAARRKLLSTALAALPWAHATPRGLLEERGYATVEQALSFWPKAYQDRTRVRAVADLRTGEEQLVRATVRSIKSRRMRTGKALLEILAADATGALGLVFFNAPPWRAKGLAAGDLVLCSGKVTEGFRGRKQMANPELEKLGPGDSASFGRIVPVYAGPTDSQHPALRKLVKRLCDEYAPRAVDDLPAPVRARRSLARIDEALREAHFPPEGTDPVMAAERATPAFRRLVFEELFFLQLALARKRDGVRQEAGIAFDATPRRIAEVTALLPFALTASQAHVLAEIAADMARPEPMNRLLQGDVGSGKTAVAFAAAMLAVRSGWQAAILAPTQILAEQHARTLSRWLAPATVELALVVGKGKGWKEPREGLASGRARIAVGTHALLEEDVAFEKLGLVVVDEQHRFGVLQRARLIGKGRRPDVLVMTATPIPRTLALAFYGDLDQSKITELPPGRTPVETKVFGDAQRKKAHAVVRRELDAGRQAYVVYPLVAESEKTDLADATTAAAELAATFAPHEVALLHGQMKAEDKEAVMARFRAGRVAVLVATTVIEVGVDVPNASVMVVEHAERFGLSQLHQLRGRVGRGAARSFCLLVAHFERSGDDARERLKTMSRTQDGFEIARADLRLRGPGELVGTRQSGQKTLEIADLYRDEAILDEARDEAFRLVAEDPALARPENAAAAEALAGRWAGRVSLARIG